MYLRWLSALLKLMAVEEEWTGAFQAVLFHRPRPQGNQAKEDPLRYQVEQLLCGPC